MKSIRSGMAVLCALLTVAPLSWSQQPTRPDRLPGAVPPEFDTSGFMGRFTRPYRAVDYAPIQLNNSSRLEALLRAGRIYLSLQDAIALSLENNLDIAVARYGPQIADADLLRAKAGGLLRGVPTTVQQGASSALSTASGGATSSGSGSSFQSSSSSGGGTTSQSGGAVITQTGVAPLNYDPVFISYYQWGHRTSIFSNTVTTGTNALTTEAHTWDSGFQQQFSTGTTVAAGFNNDIGVISNNVYSLLNPITQGNVQLQMTQRLLQGWGPSVNNRNIKIAKNNQRVSDLVFKQQVITTVASIINLYWDLVSFNEDLRVRKQALAVAEKFYHDQKKQVEIGTIAPIEVVRAEANVAQAQQDLTNAETSVLQQETILKNQLSRTGVASPTIAEARIVPTDQIRIPEKEPVEPIQDLIGMAIELRPELEQTRINIDNTKIGIKGDKSALLPSLDAQASFQNSGLAGQPNALYTGGPNVTDQFFIGGVGSSLGQMFRRNFPNYTFALTLQIPIRNRTAQSDYARDMLSLRQQELRAQGQINDIRVTVQQALTGLTQARARYQFAVKTRILQEQTLDAEQKKYALGASTAFQVIQTQRDLATAEDAEVAAMAAYNHARNDLDFATGQILQKYRIEMDDARKGQVGRGPSQIPVLDPDNKK
jgi:outer membrane protein TolC